MKSNLTWMMLLAIAVATSPSATVVAAENPEQTADDDNKVSFSRDVAPILVKRCEACHGARNAENSYRLDSFQRLLQAGDNEVDPVTPGDPDESDLFRLVSSDDVDERMPKDGDPLGEDELALIRRWIEQGAEFDGGDESQLLSQIIPRAPYPAPPETYTRPVPVTALSFHPKGDELFVGGYHELTVWNPTDGKLIRRIKDVAQRTFALAFSSDGSILAVAGGTPGRQGEIRLLNPTDGSELKLLGVVSGVVFDIAFRPDGKKLAAVSADRSLRVFDVETGDEDRVMESHADWVMGVAWSPDGKQLATASRDKTAKLFDAETGALLATYSGHAKPVFGVVFHEDGKQVYSSGADNKIHLWKSEDGKKVAVIEGIEGEVYKLIRAGEHLFSTSADKKARQHKASDRAQVRSFDGHSDWVFSLAVHPDSHRLATGSFDGQVRLWSVEDGNSIVAFTAAP